LFYSEVFGKFVYQVGDKVRIMKTPLPDNSSVSTGLAGGSLRWNDNMDEYCGKTVTISYMDKTDGTYHIEEDGGCWWWCDSFFEESAFACDSDEEDIGSCSFGDYFKGYRVV